MTGFYVFLTNKFIGKSYIFGGGLVNIFLVLTFRGSVPLITGGIYFDVIFPIVSLVLFFGFTFIYKHVSVFTVHFSGSPLNLSHPLQSVIQKPANYFSGREGEDFCVRREEKEDIGLGQDHLEGE